MQIRGLSLPRKRDRVRIDHMGRELGHKERPMPQTSLHVLLKQMCLFYVSLGYGVRKETKDRKLSTHSDHEGDTIASSVKILRRTS